MTNERLELVGYLQRSASDGDLETLGERITNLIIEHQAQRLLEHLRRIASGDSTTSDSAELEAVLQACRSGAKTKLCLITINDFGLRQMAEARRQQLLETLSAVLPPEPSQLTGRVRLYAESILTSIDRGILSFLLRAAAFGLDVAIDTTPPTNREAGIEITLLMTRGGVQFTFSALANVWSIRVLTDESRPEEPIESIDVLGRISIPALSDGVNDTVSMDSGKSSVADLFGDFIVLRDLDPRTKKLSGPSAWRSHLDLAEPFVPRKNQREYAQVVRQWVVELAGPSAQVLYVGDTQFNDGSVITNLSDLMPDCVLGFLCNEKGFGASGDFVIGPVYFASRWSSLVTFSEAVRHRGFRLGPQLVGLFDLDQTVYAAKGRNDEALYQARWEAILAFLKDTIPSYKFSPARAEAIYRQFDRDEYHRVTRDNMDYVVLLVLAVATGLCDAAEIGVFANGADNTISSLTELLQTRAMARRGHEELGDVINVIRAIHHNTLAGDQTPCKDFRRYECRATALHMRGARDAICLTREVVEFISVLKHSGASVVAISDRPYEAAVIDEEQDGVLVDLMQIPMDTLGVAILKRLVLA